MILIGGQLKKVMDLHEAGVFNRADDCADVKGRADVKIYDYISTSWAFA